MCLFYAILRGHTVFCILFESQLCCWPNPRKSEAELTFVDELAVGTVGLIYCSKRSKSEMQTDWFWFMFSSLRIEQNRKHSETASCHKGIHLRLPRAPFIVSGGADMGLMWRFYDQIWPVRSGPCFVSVRCFVSGLLLCSQTSCFCRHALNWTNC